VLTDAACCASKAPCMFLAPVLMYQLLCWHVLLCCPVRDRRWQCESGSRRPAGAATGNGDWGPAPRDSQTAQVGGCVVHHSRGGSVSLDLDAQGAQLQGMEVGGWVCCTSLERWQCESWMWQISTTGWRSYMFAVLEGLFITSIFVT